MKVLLLKEVKGLGGKGDVKDVSNGFATNFLIPKMLVQIVNKQAILVIDAQKKKVERVKKETARNKEKIALKVNGKSFDIIVKADEKGTLYAGLGVKELAEYLKKNGYNIVRDDIELSEPIKKLGVHEVKLKLAGREALLNFTVKKS